MDHRPSQRMQDEPLEKMDEQVHIQYLEDSMEDPSVKFNTNKVVLCVDGTEVGAKVLRHAAETLPKTECILCLLICYEKPAGGLYDMKQDNKAVKERAQEMLDRMKKDAENLGFDKVVTHVAVGFEARDTIAEYCIKHNFQKIFVGPSDKSWLKRKLIGTTADYLKGCCPQSDIVVVDTGEDS